MWVLDWEVWAVGVGLRGAALSTAALSSYRGGLVLTQHVLKPPPNF